jgi:hypothetical protein
MAFSLPDQIVELPPGPVEDPFLKDSIEATQRNFQALGKQMRLLSQFFFSGAGAPAFTPPGRAMYIRIDGGAGTTLYVYEGAGWVGK